MDLWNVSPEEFYSTTKLRHVTFPRQVAMLIMHKHHRMPAKKVGKRFGLRNHTTVLSGCKVVQAMYFSNKSAREKINELIRLLNISEESKHHMQLTHKAR